MNDVVGVTKTGKPGSTYKNIIMLNLFFIQKEFLLLLSFKNNRSYLGRF